MSNTPPHPTSNPFHVKLSQVLHSPWMTDDAIRTHGRLQKIFQPGKRSKRHRRRVELSMGSGYLPPRRVTGLGCVVSSPSGVRGGAPAAEDKSSAFLASQNTFAWWIDVCSSWSLRSCPMKNVTRFERSPKWTYIDAPVGYSWPKERLHQFWFLCMRLSSIVLSCNPRDRRAEPVLHLNMHGTTAHDIVSMYC